MILAVLSALLPVGSVNPLAPNPARAASASNSPIAAGPNHTCAITQGGAVQCWGYNLDGQLGNGSTTGSLTPVEVSGLGSGVSAVAAGFFHTCALTFGGGVKCWGNNNIGQLGNGTFTSSLTPVDVSGLTSGVIAIATGNNHTCAITSAGAAKCWGQNFSGQLGNGSTTSSSSPVDVAGLASGVSVIAGGSDFTCAVASGGVTCWGSNLNGTLGDGTTASSSTPVGVSGLSSGGVAVAAGSAHACALTSAGGVKCWGHNASGKLGNGTVTNSLTPVDVMYRSNMAATVAPTVNDDSGDGYAIGSRWLDIRTDTHYVAVDVTAGAAVWMETTTPASAALTGATAITTGGFSGHTCAITSVGGATCWGANGPGALGDGTSATSRLWPVGVTGLSSGVGAIAANGGHTCAIISGGGVKCWGANREGQLGNGSTTSSSIPVDVGNNQPEAKIGDVLPLDWNGPWQLSFDGSESVDADGAIANWEWEFGDGSVGSGEVATHSFSAAGTYTVTLVVTDDEGLRGTTSTKVAFVGDPFVDFAPAVRLHPEESHFPMDPAAFIANSELKWARDEGCLDSTIDPFPNADRLGTFDKATAYAAKESGLRNCRQSGRAYYGWELTRPFTADGRPKRLGIFEGFYLDFDTTKEPSSFAPVPLWTDATAAGSELVITYWLFYGQSVSDPVLPIPAPSHEGDWEHVNVRLDAATLVPRQVGYFAHHKPELMRAYPEDVEVVDYLHPVVYSALTGHASGPEPGDFQVCWDLDLPGDLHCVDDHYEGDGQEWRAWEAGGIKTVQEMPGFNFGGAWGEVGIHTDTTGPTGPGLLKDPLAPG